MAKRVLTPQTEDFPRWYQDVVAKADLAETGAARGTMVMKPWGYALWESIQGEIDKRIKATGHQNVCFPMFIPHSFLEKEAEHVEGFSPELAIVTHAGGSELAEALVVRPTSETVFGDAMSRWIQGYRDLPMKLNQWANVVRWEMRPRLFLRTSEFLWQEGHTAHATYEDAQAEVLMVHQDIYQDVLTNHMAIDAIPGIKTKNETFAGAMVTYTHEGMMKDGKALQMATSHNLGQNFAKAFDITYSSQENNLEHVWTTSWGLSTRTIGALIMAHGDDNGLVLPPKMAPKQVVVICLQDSVIDQATALAAQITSFGIRVELDVRTEQGFGRRATEWELKGVPVRIEVGPRDVEAGVVMMAIRDQEGKQTVALEDVAQSIHPQLIAMQERLLETSRARRKAQTRTITSLDEVDYEGFAGFYELPWANVGDEGEQAVQSHAWTVRCLYHPSGVLPTSREDEGLIAVLAKAY